MKMFIIALFIMVTSVSPQETNKISLNSNWKFAKSEMNDISHLDRINWEKVNIPHTWNDKDVRVRIGRNQ